MSERDKLLHQITKANPVPNDAGLPGDVVDSRPPLGLLINEGGTPRPGAGPQRPGRAGRRWRGPLIAAGTAAGILVLVSASTFFLGGDTSDVIVEPAPTTTISAIGNDTDVAAATVDAGWSLEGTVEGWLTEPVLVDGRYFAMRKDLGEGVVEGTILGVGDLWTSPDGATWVPAKAGVQKPAAPADGPTTGARVELRRNPVGDEFGILNGLWATTDGETWREVALRPSNDNWMPTVAAGGLGWVVYSPPVEGTVSEFGGGAYLGPRAGNLGLWYTPDTEAWVEVTDLGPLVDAIHEIGEVGVIDTTMIVRDNDILVFAYIAKNLGFGAVSKPHTEIWRLDLSPGEPTATTVAIEAAAWNTVLADTRAQVPPAPATCPPSATPNTPGPSDQARPTPHWVGNLAGAFDRHTGRIVYVDTAGETWTFDVCTNTWHQMNPGSGPVPDEELYDAAGKPSGVLGQLVYDIDSDVTIALGHGGVSVYDANTNTWSERDDPPEDMLFLGAVYDPISGLVITSTPHGGEDWDLWAYDVDTDEWTQLGTVTVDRDTPCCTQIDLLGYSTTTDSLILTTYSGLDPTTILINPRTGDTNLVPTGALTGTVDLAWPGKVYGPGADTVYVYGHIGSGTLAVARFDSATSAWAMIEIPAEVPNWYDAFGAVVDDPINHRLLLINGVHGDWRTDATDDIWAVDLASGQWTQIVEPSPE